MGGVRGLKETSRLEVNGYPYRGPLFHGTERRKGRGSGGMGGWGDDDVGPQLRVYVMT